MCGVRLAPLAMLFIVYFLHVFPSPAHGSVGGCAAKESRLEQQLSYARLYGHPYRIAGLERALLKVRYYCNDPPAGRGTARLATGKGI